MKHEVRSMKAGAGYSGRSLFERSEFRRTEYPAPAIQGSRGITTLLVIAFMGIFLLIMGTITSYAFEEAKYGRALLGREQALHVAESGLEYYRWFLAHNPGDLQNGTGLAGPYSYAVDDPETGVSIGSAAVSVSGNIQCGQIQSIDITSKGTATANPGFPRTLFARYMQTSVAAYAFITNSSVWYKSTVTGTILANNGVRMDGTNYSYVQSQAATWTCTSSQGCSPSATKPGVFGAGPNSSLWVFPVTGVNFNSMTNFANLKTYAQASGIMLNPTSVQIAGVQQGSTFASVGGSDSTGFHLVFNADGTVTIYRVTSTDSVESYDSVRGYLHGSSFCAANHNSYPCDYDYDHPDIASGGQTLLGTYAVPSGCSLIYSQAKTWIDGTVSGKVTVAAADTSGSGYTPDIMLDGNINYATHDGTTGLTAIAQRSVLISLLSPDPLSLHGIFVAQNGTYGRDYFDPSVYTTAQRSQLTMNGTEVSALQAGTCWGCGSSGWSGYDTSNSTTAYDQLQATNPPPFTPAASVDYGFVLWKEE